MADDQRLADRTEMWLRLTPSQRADLQRIAHNDAALVDQMLDGMAGMLEFTRCIETIVAVSGRSAAEVAAFAASLKTLEMEEPPQPED